MGNRSLEASAMKLDPLDVRILKALQADARLSFRELARRTGSTAPTVIAHVGELERLGVVRGYRAELDPLRLGHTSVVFVVRVAAGRRPDLVQTIARLPEVRWAMETREGRVVAEAVFRRDEDAGQFARLLRKLPGVLATERHVARALVKGRPRVPVSVDAQVLVACFECDKAIEGQAVIRRLDGRRHYFCCPSCESLFVGRYRRLKAAA